MELFVDQSSWKQTIELADTEEWCYCINAMPDKFLNCIVHNMKQTHIQLTLIDRKSPGNCRNENPLRPVTFQCIRKVEGNGGMVSFLATSMECWSSGSVELQVLSHAVGA